MLLDVVAQFRATCSYDIIEPAHMEIAEPSIATAFSRCVEQGAGRVVVFPYFLLPGRHWNKDIPHLTAEAAANHPGVEFLVTSPLAVHPLMSQIISDRIQMCLSHTLHDAEACEICAGTDKCQMRQVESTPH
ncbi:UNVERIFIED_CONTAM: hypothetical protein GTU68_003255 [Idotea baltica]|nr:hypothetical protein [Idotea baltica]